MSIHLVTGGAGFIGSNIKPFRLSFYTVSVKIPGNQSLYSWISSVEFKCFPQYLAEFGINIKSEKKSKVFVF